MVHVAHFERLNYSVIVEYFTLITMVKKKKKGTPSLNDKVLLSGHNKKKSHITECHYLKQAKKQKQCVKASSLLPQMDTVVVKSLHPLMGVNVMVIWGF